MSQGVIKVSVSEMGIAENNLRSLQERISECRLDLLRYNTDLQGAWDGASAREFDNYTTSVAAPILDQCSDMCYQTANAIRHTCDQFTEADTTLSGTFKG